MFNSIKKYLFPFLGIAIVLAIAHFCTIEYAKAEPPKEGMTRLACIEAGPVEEFANHIVNGTADDFTFRRLISNPNCYFNPDQPIVTRLDSIISETPSKDGKYVVYVIKIVIGNGFGYAFYAEPLTAL